jgi:large subunit ribosomal protein L21
LQAVASGERGSYSIGSVAFGAKAASASICFDYREGLDMYVVFEDGSRQYRVQEGQVVKLDFRKADIGTSLEFNRILLAERDGTATIGQPLITGARVVAEVVDLPKEKTYIQRFRRRKNYRRFKGHTQPYTSVRVQQIVLP